MGLYCFPKLNKIVYLSFDSTGIGCLPDYPKENVSSVPALTLCGLTNPHGCATYPDGLTTVSVEVLSIYPNPVTDILTVSIGNDMGSTEEYELTDLQGRIVLSGVLEHNITNINIVSLTTGIYLLHLNGENTGAYKVVKN